MEIIGWKNHLIWSFKTLLFHRIRPLLSSTPVEFNQWRGVWEDANTGILPALSRRSKEHNGWWQLTLWSFVGEGFFVGYAFGPHFRLPGGLRSVPKCHVEMEGAQERISSVPAACPGSSPVPNINMYAICHIALPFDGWKPANRQKRRWSRHETQTRQIFSNLTFHQSDQNVCQTERQNFCQVKIAKDLPDRTPYLMPDRTPEATPEEITDNRMPQCMRGFMWRGVGRSKELF